MFFVAGALMDILFYFLFQTDTDKCCNLWPLCTGEQVLQEDVDALHARFYAEMEGMFHRHKHRNPAFENAKLTMLYKHIA